MHFKQTLVALSTILVTASASPDDWTNNCDLNSLIIVKETLDSAVQQLKDVVSEAGYIIPRGQPLHRNADSIYAYACVSNNDETVLATLGDINDALSSMDKPTDQGGCTQYTKSYASSKVKGLVIGKTYGDGFPGCT